MFKTNFPSVDIFDIFFQSRYSNIIPEAKAHTSLSLTRYLKHVGTQLELLVEHVIKDVPAQCLDNRTMLHIPSS